MFNWKVGGYVGVKDNFSGLVGMVYRDFGVFGVDFWEMSFFGVVCRILVRL